MDVISEGLATAVQPKARQGATVGRVSVFGQRIDEEKGERTVSRGDMMTRGFAISRGSSDLLFQVSRYNGMFQGEISANTPAGERCS